MLRLAAAFCLALTVCCLGCAGTEPKSDNVAKETLDADYHDCEIRGYVSTALIKSPGEATEQQEQIIDACMKEKGYSVK
ncbi:MAG: hypothetical protein ACP59X_01430 [Solidesulfovibrio sp. DCME]|uniref:hypothetical protein n=1 Tax=Solidesulfovibrio sp. DCME TaxID=3447380 RepID=UPI003D121F59